MHTSDVMRLKLKCWILFSSLFVLTRLPAFAQDFEWVTEITGSGYDYGIGIVLGDSGKVITGGNFEGSIDADPGPGTVFFVSAGSTDIFLTKLDSNGIYQSGIRLGGTGSETLNDICTDKNGNIYLAGIFTGTMDFDPGLATYSLTASSSGHGFVCVLDSGFNFKFAVNFVASDGSCAYGVRPDSSGQVWITGTFEGALDLNPGLPVSTVVSDGPYNDIFICKVDALGNFIWGGKVGGPVNEQNPKVVVNSLGEVFVSGTFQESGDYDPGPGIFSLIAGAGNQELFLAKLDSSGNLIWVNQIGGTSNEYNREMAINKWSEVVLTGMFPGVTDFDPGPGVTNLTSAGGNDAYIAKYDSSGALVWAGRIGNASPEEGTSVAINDSGEVIFTGGFAGTMDADPGPGVANIVSASFADFFIVVLDSSGNFEWARPVGGAGVEGAVGLESEKKGYVYTTGVYSGSSDFDPGSGTFILNTASSGNAFTLKLGPSCVPTASGQAVSACFEYLSPSGNYLWVTSGIHFDTIPNAEGCDSVISFNLFITQIDTLVLSNDSVLTAFQTGAAYQWLNCDSGGMAIGGDTLQTFSRDSGGNFAVIISKNGCADTSGCHFLEPQQPDTNTTNLISENRIRKGIKVYPNPAVEQLKIILQEPEQEKTMTIRDLAGRSCAVLKTSSFHPLPDGKAELNLNIDFLPSGCYFLEIGNSSVLFLVSRLQ